MFRVQRAFASQGPHPPNCLERKIAAQRNKHGQRKDLKRQPGNHDIVSRRRVFPGMRLRARIPTAGRLQHQRKDITGNEDARIVLRRNAAVVCAEGRRYAREAEVEARGVEGGSYR